MVAASLILMPLSYASILGGATTLIGTSTNLILAGLVVQQLSTDRIPPGMEPLSIFTPTSIAAPTAIVGIAFIILVGARLLPKPVEEAIQVAERRLYKALFLVEPNTNIVGKLVKDSRLFKTEGFELISLMRDSAINLDIHTEPLPEKKTNIFQKFLALFKWRKGKKALPERRSEFDLG
jgi:di/tricarboxylate transporter